MGLETGDLESCVEAIYDIAGFDDDEVSMPSRVARKILGPTSVIRVPNLRALGALSRVNGESVIAVRGSLDVHRREHTVGHELAHWYFEREGYEGEDLEACCDFVGAAIQTRRSVFRGAARSRDWAQLAFDFAATETLVVLRFGEVTGVPIVVIAPHLVRVRGDDFSWPHESEIRRQARGTNVIPGIAKIRLTDDRRRFALVAE